MRWSLRLSFIVVLVLVLSIARRVPERLTDPGFLLMFGAYLSTVWASRSAGLMYRRRAVLFCALLLAMSSLGLYNVGGLPGPSRSACSWSSRRSYFSAALPCSHTLPTPNACAEDHLAGKGLDLPGLSGFATSGRLRAPLAIGRATQRGGYLSNALALSLRMSAIHWPCFRPRRPRKPPRRFFDRR